jgi:hypothetical protein
MRKVLAIGAVVLGVGIICFWVVKWMTTNETHRFRCKHEGSLDGTKARCVHVYEGKSHELPIGSVQKVYVSHSRSAGYSLKATSPSGSTTVLAPSTMHGDSVREYENAARKITEFLAGHTESVDVSYTLRVGIAQLVIGILFGAFCIGGGVLAFRRPK